MSFDYDLITIGAGSGGVRAARIAAQLGAKVAIVEAAALGGTCVNAGCIPKKMLVYGANRVRMCEDAAGFGLSLHGFAFEWATLIAAKDREVARLNEVYGRTLERAGAEIVRGRAKLVDANTIEVDGRALRGRHLLIATGGVPSLPDVPGRELGITSNEVLALKQLPARVVVVGAGVIALELASLLHGVGSRVSILHRGQSVLGDFDHDAGAHAVRELRKHGIEIHFGVEVEEIARQASELAVSRNDGVVVRADALIFATGRRPNTDALGLDEVGVERSLDGSIVVDTFGRTRVQSIFAIGDCIGGAGLTPRAIAHGEAVARNLFGGGASRRIEPELLPRAVFSHPEVASVGLSERQACVRYERVAVYRSDWRPLEMALSGHDDRSFVKLVVDRDSDRVLGVHMVGKDAPEVIQGFAVALQCGATKAQLDATLGIHPTAAEELVTLKTADA